MDISLHILGIFEFMQIFYNDNWFDNDFFIILIK